MRKGNNNKREEARNNKGDTRKKTGERKENKERRKANEKGERSSRLVTEVGRRRRGAFLPRIPVHMLNLEKLG